MKESYDELSDYLDQFAVEVVKDSDSFHAASAFEKQVWGVGCLLHHGGANGLDAVLDYNHSDAPITLLSGVEGLHAVGALELHSSALLYWREITAGAHRAGIIVPLSVDEGKRDDFYRIYDYWMDDILAHRAARQRARQWSDMFLSCWDTELPRLTLAWIQNEKKKCRLTRAKQSHGSV